MDRISCTLSSKRFSCCLLLCCCLIFLWVTQGQCQTCAVVGSLEGNYLVTIDGESYLAAPIEIAKEALKAKEELDAALKKLHSADSLLASYEQLNSAYARHFRLHNVLLEQTQQLYSGYKELARDYKKIHGEAFIRLSGGVGALHDSDKDDYIPILLVGASAWRISAWAFLNSRDSGFIFGGNLPLKLRLPF